MTYQLRLRIKGIYIISLLFCFSSSVSVLGQESQRNISVNYITESIELDGILDETEWQTADNRGDFWQFFPTDSIRSQLPTEFSLLYDEHNLYIGIKGEVTSNNYVVSSLRRDFRGTTSDNVTLMFDTFKDGNTAFLFGMTPYGVQREALISLGGSADGFNATWDQKWQLESKMYDGYFILEAAIPLSSIKFREGETEWRVQCYRWDIGDREQSAWVHVPQNQVLSSLAFMGKMVFEKPLPKSRTPLALIPYINALSSKDFESGLTDSKLKFGGDAKVAIGNSMNLDITVNPDFSNIEVDDIFTNLTRFEVLLPEKRQFFTDNSDLFGSYGSFYSDAKPFFSRRIGLVRNNEGNLIENRILGGVRLSGKIGEDWRLGVLNVQTEEDISNGIASNNNMMVALQKKVFARSNIGVFMVNRQSFNDYSFLDNNDKYNRVMGIDYKMASEDNTWTGSYFLHKSFQPNDKRGNLASEAVTIYKTRRFRYTSHLVYIDKDFQADLGYVPRTNYLKAGNGLQFWFYPKKGILNSHSISPLMVYYWNPNNLKKTDHDFRLAWQAELKDQSTMTLRLTQNYTYLLSDFDPTRTTGVTPLPGNRGYTYSQFHASYQSNLAKLFTYNLESTAGQFYNGNILSVGGEFAYRLQPWASFSAAVNYDKIRLPDPYSDANIWLVSPKVDITFNKSFFWSTLVQYSSQRKNLGVNSRLQWRFAPLSDLYLVYNDNYFTDDFGPRFRSINLKLKYWLNI